MTIDMPNHTIASGNSQNKSFNLYHNVLTGYRFLPNTLFCGFEITSL